MKILKYAIVSAMVMAGAAFAEGDATDPAAVAREAVMKEIGGAMGKLGGMAKGEIAYDAAEAEAAKAALVAASAKAPEAFKEAGGEDATSEAKAEIWTNWDDFLKKDQALAVAAAAIDVSSAEAIGASLGTIGGTCKDCHSVYRMKK